MQNMHSCTYKYSILNNSNVKHKSSRKMRECKEKEEFVSDVSNVEKFEKKLMVKKIKNKIK
jgi:hypothetical protein